MIVRTADLQRSLRYPFGSTLNGVSPIYSASPAVEQRCFGKALIRFRMFIIEFRLGVECRANWSCRHARRPNRYQ